MNRSSAANEGFIGLDHASHLTDAALVLREANAAHHEPRGFLCDLKRPRYFVRRDTVLVVREHPHSSKPLVEPYRGILEYCADFHRELLAAFKACPSLSGP